MSVIVFPEDRWEPVTATPDAFLPGGIEWALMEDPPEDIPERRPVIGFGSPRPAGA